MPAAFDESGFAQDGLVDLSARIEVPFERGKIDHSVIGRERPVVESTSRNATVQWHLAALETEPNGGAGASLLAFVAAAGGLAMARAFAATEAFPAVLGAGAGSESVKSQ